MRAIIFNAGFIIWFFSLLTHLSAVVTPARVFNIFGHEFQFPWFWDTISRIIDKTLSVTNAQVGDMLKIVIIHALVLLPLMMLAQYLPRLFQNKRNTDHGAADWATEKELRKGGLIGRYGIIFGQCNNAKYKEVEDRRKPRLALSKKDREKRKKAETENPEERQLYRYELVKPGDVISYHSNKHCIIVGTTRSGKGISCVIPTCLSWNESLVVLDPKGEAWSITAPVRAQFSKTFKFEPENPAESVHYNPILAVRRGLECIPDIQNLGQILMPAGSGGSGGEFWINEARKLFTALVGYIVYCKPVQEKNFGTLIRLFSDERVPIQGERSTKAYLKAYADEINTYIANQGLGEERQNEYDRLKNSDNPEDRKEFEAAQSANILTKEDIQTLKLIYNDLISCYNEEDKVLQDVLSTMTSTLTFFSDPNVQEVTRYSDFTFEDTMYGDTPISIYMVASSAALVRLAPLFKIMYEQSIAILTRKLRKFNYRLLLLFDEFRQMGKMEIVEKSLSLSAGYGVICMIIVQSYAQLTQIYQHKAVLLDNFAFQVVLNASDPENLKDIEAQLGNRTVRRKKYSYGGTKDKASADSENINIEEKSVPLMTVEEIRRMDFEDGILIPLGMHPYKMKKIMWYADPRFTSLTDKYKELPTLEGETGMSAKESAEKGGVPTPWHAIFDKERVQPETVNRQRFQSQETVIDNDSDDVRDRAEGDRPMDEPALMDEEISIELDFRSIGQLFETQEEEEAGKEKEPARPGIFRRRSANREERKVDVDDGTTRDVEVEFSATDDEEA